MKKNVLSTLARLSLFAFACLSIGTAASAEPQSTFEVGLVLPMTGAAADYGIAIKNCIDLAVKDKPQLFTNIRFHYEDAAYDPKNAVIALGKLIDSEKVNIAVTWGVSFCKALAPVAEARKMPLVGICLDPTIAANRHYVLRFKNTTDEIMQLQTKYLSEHGVKRIGVLLAEHPYLEELTQALKRNLQEGQTMEVVDEIPNTEMDLRTNIAKLMRRKSEFDSIGVFLSVGQIATFYKQAHDVQFDIPTFGTDFFESLSEVRASNGTMNGVIFTSVNIKEAFLKRYKEIFHNESQLAFGAPAYEFAMTVGELFNTDGSKMSPDAIVKSFSSATARDGVASGPYKYVNDAKVGQYFQFPLAVKKIVNENFEPLK